MRLGVTGSRDFPATGLVERHICKHAEKYPDSTVVSGGRGNVDAMAEETALACGLDVMSYRPTDDHVEVWGSVNGQMVKISEVFGERDFVRNCFFRNGYIADSDVVVGFWDLRSRGTADTLSRAKGKGRRRFVWDPTGRLLSEEELDRIVHEVLG